MPNLFLLIVWVIYIVLSQEMMPVNMFLFLGAPFSLAHSFSGGMTGCREISLSFLFEEHPSLPPPTPAKKKKKISLYAQL